MRKLFILNADEAMTLILLSKLNDDILKTGLNSENRGDLLTLQIELLDIVRKITYKTFKELGKSNYN